MVGAVPSREAGGEGYLAALGPLRVEEAGAETRTGKLGARGWRSSAKARGLAERKSGLRVGLDYSWGAASRLGN